MRIRIAILDHDAVFKVRLAAALKKRYRKEAKVYLFSDSEKVLAALRDSNINILLANQSFHIDRNRIPFSCVLIYLTDSHNFLEKNKKVYHSTYCRFNAMPYASGASVITLDKSSGISHLCDLISTCVYPCMPQASEMFKMSREIRSSNQYVLPAENVPDSFSKQETGGIPDVSAALERTDENDACLIRIRTNEAIPINKPVYRIGRSDNAIDYSISDNPTVSRQHADIIQRGGEFFLVDHNSINHTYVDGAIIPNFQEIKLKDGARIRLSDEEFEFWTRPVTRDDVQFRCAAPMVIRPGKYFTAKIMMLLDGDDERAERESCVVADKVRIGTSSVWKASKGEEFTVCLQSPDLPDLEETGWLRWNGRYAATEFEILLPADYRREQLRLLGRVYSGITPVTDIKVILEVCAVAPQNVICETLLLRTAFVSYASKDRSEVAKRIQGMESVRPDMDIFFDRKNLIRGEEYEPRIQQEIHDRDLFLLFWSRNAAASEWVNKELTYALSHKPETQIEPIPLEAPEVCPPPEKLKHRHFWDWTMQYTT